ncbi:unnamed protein product [Rhizopus stolonifer]
MGFLKLSGFHKKNRQPKDTSSKDQITAGSESLYNDVSSSSDISHTLSQLDIKEKGKTVDRGLSSSLSTHTHSRESLPSKYYSPSIASKREQKKASLQDSDISDSEEEEEEEEEDNKFMATPIAKTSDPTELSQTGNTMIERMRERHRNQVKMAALKRHQDLSPYALQRPPEGMAHVYAGNFPPYAFHSPYDLEQSNGPMVDDLQKRQLRTVRSNSSFQKQLENGPLNTDQTYQQKQQQLYQQFYQMQYMASNNNELMIRKNQQIFQQQQAYQYEQLRLMQQQHYMSMYYQPKSSKSTGHVKSVYSTK